MKKALLLEDDSALGKGISLALNSQELQIDLCRTLCEARDKSVSEYALLILDINLPDGSGLDYLRELRANRCSVPAIMLTANDMETDVVVGLESGADDYITKPFSLAILRARINAQLAWPSEGLISLRLQVSFDSDLLHDLVKCQYRIADF